MAIVSAIRVGGEQYRGNYDFTWLFFWLEVEACIAVSVISLTAFPAVFVSNASRRSGGRAPNAHRGYYSSSMGKPRRGKKIPSTDDSTEASLTSEWPTYPPTAAGGGRRTGRTDTKVRDEAEEEMPLGQHAQPGGQQDVRLQGLARGNPSTDTIGPDRV